LLDARFFVTAVLTQRESGGNLSEVLDSLAALIRDRFRLRRQVRTLSAHGRITGWVLACLPPSLAAATLLLNPDHLGTLFGDPVGIRMIIVAIFLILLVLIQKGRGGGLASAFGGGGGNTAFGSKTGDVLTWATSIVFGVFLILAIGLNIVANHVNAASVPVKAVPAGPTGPAAPAQGGTTSLPQVPPGSTDPAAEPKVPATAP